MMDLERLARLHAALQGGASCDELLRRERVTRAQWLAAERAWLGALSTEAASGRFELSARYLGALSGDPAPAPAPRAEAAPVTTATPVPVAPPVPTITVPAIPAAMLRFVDVQSTQDSAAAPAESVALPFVAASAPPAAPSAEAPRRPPPAADPRAWLPRGMRGLTEVDGTQAAPSSAPGPALPFADVAPSSQPAPDPRSAVPAGMRGFADVDGTQLAAPGAATAAALPFNPSADPRPAAPPAAERPAAERPAASPTWMPKGMAGFADVDGTQAVSSAPVSVPLPFAPAERQEKAPEKAPDPPRAAAPEDRRESVAEPSPASAPARPPAAPPRLTLDQYARLCVELAAYPAHRADVLRRYDIDEDHGRQVAAFWTAHMTADANIRRAWEAHCATHQAWLHAAHRR